MISSASGALSTNVTVPDLCLVRSVLAGLGDAACRRNRLDLIRFDVHIEEAGHIQVLMKFNPGDAGCELDSIPPGEEIERLSRVQEHCFLLNKLKSEVIVEEGGFT